MTISTPKVKIERVGFPQSVHRQRWPFDKMKVGDSFIIPNELVNTIRSAVSYWGKRHAGQKFAIKRQFDGQTRCYRIK